MADINGRVNVLTRQDLINIFAMYNVCKNNNGRKIEALNVKFAEIVEAATRHIQDYANGKIAITPDAADVMNDYIEEFGKEYMRYANGWKYDFTKEARSAKIKLSRLVLASKQRDCNVMFPNKITRDEKNSDYVFEKKETAKKINNVVSLTNQEKKKIVLPNNDKKTDINVGRKSIKHSNAKRKNDTFSWLKKWSDNLVTSAKNNIVKTISNIKNMVVGLGRDCVDSVSRFAKRYAVVGLTMFGACGSLNTYPSQNRDNLQIKEFKSEVSSSQQEAINSDTTKVITPSQFVNDEKVWSDEKFADEKEIVTDSIGENSLREISLNDSVENNINLKAWESYLLDMNPMQDSIDVEDVQTIADMSFPNYEFSIEDVKALQTTEMGNEMAKHAWHVAQDMNAKNLCYRAVKKMFLRGNKGEMHGGSAYMATSYLDNNPHYKRIYCDINAIKYLPNGSCIVLGRNKRHVHGHVFVIGRDKNGKPKDLSSKVRNILRNMGDYNGAYVYVPANTPLPQRVQDGINSIKVLRPKEDVKIDNRQFVFSNMFSKKQMVAKG